MSGQKVIRKHHSILWYADNAIKFFEVNLWCEELGGYGKWYYCFFSSRECIAI